MYIFRTCLIVIEDELRNIDTSDRFCYIVASITGSAGGQNRYTYSGDGMGRDESTKEDSNSKVQLLLRKSEEENRQKRIAREVKEYVSGSHAILHQDEFALQLPVYIINLFKSGRDKEASNVLRVLGESVVGEDILLRKRAVMVLSLFAEDLFTSENQEYLLFFTGLLVEWLAIETEYIPGYEVIGRQIEKSGRWLLENHYWQEAEYLLATIYNIQTDVLEKNDFIKKTTAKIQNKLGNIDNLDIVLGSYEAGSEDIRQSLEQILFYLNRQFVRYAIFKLDRKKEGPARELLFELISKLGPEVTPCLREQLQENPSSSCIKNCIEIIKKLGESSNYPIIERFLSHHDQHIRKGVVESITVLGGSSTTIRLTRALQQADEHLKILILKQLAKTENNEVVPILHEQCTQLLSGNRVTNDHLFTTLMVALRRFPSDKSIDLINRIISKFPEVMEKRKIELQINETLKHIESHLRHETHLNKTVEISLNPGAPLNENSSAYNDEEFELELLSLLDDGKIPEATEELLKKCIEHSREKDFATAEMLRDRILEVDPQAFSKVLEAEENIILEKQTSVPGSFFQKWEGFRGVMSEAEIEQLYTRFEKAFYASGEVVVREGEIDDRLYFVNSGVLRMKYSQGGRDIFLKKILPGEFFGTEQFFSASVWTVNVSTSEDTELLVLSRSRVKSIFEDNPEFYKKLKTYCVTARSVYELIEMAGEDRRDSIRYNVMAKEKIVLMDSYGTYETKSITCKLNDISLGGFCFTTRIANSENARLLLGRQVKAPFISSIDESKMFDAVIVAVQVVQEIKNEFKVHARMVEPLSDQEVQKIVNLLF